MAKRAVRLRLVHSQDEPAKPPARWQGEDGIFFHKSQLKLGTRLINFGRLAHGEEWEVVEIKTYYLTSTGKLTSRKVAAVEKLTDDITVRAVGRNELRCRSFGTFSYSAIWRLA